MKYVIFIFLFILCKSEMKAQQLSMEIGRVATKFNYTDSEGNGIDNLYPVNHFAYSVGYRHELSRVFFLTGQLSFNRYGVFGSDPLYKNEYEWDVRYLGLGVGADAEVFRFKKFTALIRLSVDPQFMISGTQKISDQIYDLRNVEQFDRPFLFLRYGGGINYCLDNRIAIFAKYMRGNGLPLGKSDDPEKLKLISGTFSLGILVSLKYYNYCFTRHFKK